MSHASRREYPDRPWVGVGVVVRRQGRVLLVRRGRPPRLGQWGLPGGAQHLGETVAEAAVREVREETGLDVVPAGVVTVVDGITRDAEGAVLYHYTLVEVAADAPDGEPVAGDDVDAVRWATPEEAASLVEWGETLRVIALALRSAPEEGSPPR
ncbi:NUDIX hydrolase [Arenibaculum sp.]|jgi:ADP-ribose pyrophosphatase YjhB (NUDIX family)|uniref:NUDIX hydrolase n=1 Tax=Arenibaculum sp. TaxID=2865862 RepID=UPI002E0EA3D0|nr:NUDIX domain-containing protein [Arenibaculum sp.]